MRGWGEVEQRKSLGPWHWNIVITCNHPGALNSFIHTLRGLWLSELMHNAGRRMKVH